LRRDKKRFCAAIMFVNQALSKSLKNGKIRRTLFSISHKTILFKKILLPFYENNLILLYNLYYVFWK